MKKSTRFFVIFGKMFLAVAFAAAFFVPSAVARERGWLEGWSYSRAIVVTNLSDIDLRDYQVFIKNPLYDESGLITSKHFEKEGGSLSFAASEDVVDAGDIGTVSAMEFHLTDDNAKDGILEFNASSGVSIKSRKIATYGIAKADIYVNGAKGAGLTASGPNYVAIVFDKPVSADAVKIGVAAGDYTQGSIDGLKFYGVQLSGREIVRRAEAKFKSDYSDIRFTDSDGSKLLRHWMEKDGNFWVKVPEIPKNSFKVIYIYYGNAAAGSASSAPAVFDFYDDFESGDLKGWQTESWEVKSNAASDAGSYVRGGYSAYSKAPGATLSRSIPLAMTGEKIKVYAVAFADPKQEPGDLELRENGAKKIAWVPDGAWQAKEAELSSKTPVIKFTVPYIGASGAMIDDIYIRKYVTPEPVADVYAEQVR